MRGARAVRTGVILSGLAVLVASGAASQTAVAVGVRPMAIRATGPLLLDEDFTGATAIPEFSAYGDACLTGAPASGPGPLPGGIHPLAGCPTDPSEVSPPLNATPNGFLRLTDAVVDQAGAVLYETAIRSTDGVEITFEQWQYGGFSTIGSFPDQTADGISFFLVDATVAPGFISAPGAFGGSLGYAQKLPNNEPGTVIPGIDGGYLGFGFDVLGNYFGDWEQRGLGCGTPGPYADGLTSPAGDGFLVPAPGPNLVTVRGPGNGTQGYCYLGASTDATSSPWTSLLPGLLHGPTTAVSDDPATAVTDLLPSRRTITVVLEPEPDHHVTVFVDVGTGPVQVLDILAPDPVPPVVKFGFAASTGAFTDVHLIRTMRIQALDPVPQLTLSKTAVPLAPEPLQAGDQVRYDVVVSNTGGGGITGIVVHDPTVGPVICPQTDLAEGESMTCTAVYTLTQADLDRGEVLNTAFATGDGRDGEVTSNEGEARVDLSGLAPSGGDGAALLATAAAGVVAVLVGLALARRARSRQLGS